MAVGESRAPVAEKEGSLHTLQVETHARVEFRDITDSIQALIAKSGTKSGICHVFIPHTSAAVMVQENDDSALQRDFDEFLKQLVPQGAPYHHNDGNCDAHLKAALIGSSKTLFVENGRLVLGRWQGVFLCEFDGPRHRQAKVKLVSD